MVTQEKARARAERYLRECAEYSDSFEHGKLVGDWMKTVEVAKKVVGDFKARAGDTEGTHLLDIGFGSGMYSIAFAQAGADVSGLEINEVLSAIARENAADDKVQVDFRLYDGSTFPFDDRSFDYLFSVSVLEHVSDTGFFLAEASRVLKPGGKFYLAFPNRWRPVEAHTGILFLSYFPRPLAQFLLRSLWKRNSIEELNLYFLSFWKLKRMLKQTSLTIVPEYMKGSGLRRLFKRGLWTFGIHHSAILGTVMVILEKK